MKTLIDVNSLHRFFKNIAFYGAGLCVSPPPTRVKTIEDEFWRELHYSDDWVDSGLFPKPKTNLQWYKYHLLHGLMMGYPIYSIVAFIIKAVIEDNFEVDTNE